MISPDTPPASEDILFGREGGVATVTLNRPRALNALHARHVSALRPDAARLGGRPGGPAVLVRGAGERAFCAGGDVRAIYEAGRGHFRRRAI